MGEDRRIPARLDRLVRWVVTPPQHLGRDQARRFALTGWMLLAGAALLGFFIPFDLFYTGYGWHAAAEAVTLAILLAIYARYRRTCETALIGWVASTVTGLLILFLVASGRPSDQVAAWAPFYAAIPFFLLGARKGLLVLLGFAAGLLGVLGWLLAQGATGLSVVALYNVVGATLGTGAFLFYYEHGRASSARVLEEAANTDFLTGVANRRHLQALFEIEAARARRHHRPLTLLLADLDHFKAVNDTYGHDVGDLVIRHAARIMVDALRREDIVGRIGGEEFAVLLPDTSGQAAATAAEAIRAAMEQSPARPGLTVTVSIGASEAAWGEDFATVFARADARLYEAKAGGRNRVVAGPDKPAHSDAAE